jgi:hypothetical protein
LLLQQEQLESLSAASKSATRVSTTRTTAGVAMMQGHGAEVAAVLASLVTKGTITQAQSDAITAALAAAEAAEHANGSSRCTWCWSTSIQQQSFR